MTNDAEPLDYLDDLDSAELELPEEYEDLDIDPALEDAIRKISLEDMKKLLSQVTRGGLSGLNSKEYDLVRKSLK